MSIDALQIDEHFPILTPSMDIEALRWTGGMEFYENMESHFGTFENHVLISCHRFNEAWSTWECHPKGDEIVLLLSGSADMALLREGNVEKRTLNAPGSYLIVPRGCWHTALDASNAHMLFITPGEGTENLETPPGL